VSPDFVYRPATPADVPVMIENFTEGFETFRAFAPPGWEIPLDGSDEAKLAANLALPRASAIVAESGGQPAGHVLLIPAEHSRDPVPDPQLAHVMHVFVREPFRGSGVAGELLRRLMDGARDDGYERARLFTPAEQVRARRFYEREGWHVAHGPHHDEGLDFAVVEYRRDVI
jgi:GNAT superfamily N-acetyltransferase